MSETIEIEKTDLMALLDVATNSMDFGSGFLDDEEVGILRRVAELIGIDPSKATPSNFQTKFVHDFVPTERWFFPPRDYSKPLVYPDRLTEGMKKPACESCGLATDDPAFGGLHR